MNGIKQYCAKIKLNYAKFLILAFIGFLLVFISVLLTPRADSSSLAEELRRQIESKNAESEKLQKEITAYQAQIAETQKNQKGLNANIDAINKNIQYLNNSIRLAEIQIGDLRDQIFELNKQVVRKENDIEQIKMAMAESMQKFYEIERDSLLAAFLRNDTISDFMEAKYHMVNLQSDLNKNLEKFQNLQDDLRNLKKESEQKKSQREITKDAMSNKKVIIENEKGDKLDILAKTKNQEKIYQQLLSESDKKRKAIEEEMDLLEEKLRLAVDPSSLPSPRSGVLNWPAKGTITQEYGATKFAQNHYYSKFHNGIDIALALGTPLAAAESGKVAALGDQDKYCRKGAYGKFVVIKHDNNLATLYAHLSSIKVNVGQEVKQGDIIGYSGRTGYSTGPHLHFTVYDNRTFEMTKSKSCGPMPAGGSVDPMLYL